MTARKMKPADVKALMTAAAKAWANREPGKRKLHFTWCGTAYAVNDSVMRLEVRKEALAAVSPFKAMALVANLIEAARRQLAEAQS
jgi:hypothetical protein